MGFYGLLADVEAFGDLAVLQATNDQSEHLTLPLCQLHSQVRPGLSCGDPCRRPDRVAHVGGDRLTDDDGSSCHEMDGSDQFRWFGTV